MFDLFTTLLILTAALNAGLFVFVYSGDRHSPVNRSFALFVLCLCAWSLLHIGFRIVRSDALAGELLTLSYVCALLIGASFYYFSIAFPQGERPSVAHAIALALVTVFFSLELLTPGFLTGPVVPQPYGRSVVLYLPAYIAFVAVFAVLFFGGQVRLWLKYRSAVVGRAQLLAVAASVTTIGLLGIYFDLLLPSPFLENFQYVWTGPVLTSVFAIVITYAIFRFRLFNLKAAIAELLVFAWWFIILVRLLVARSIADEASDLVLLAVSVPIGVLLLRGLKLEAKARERLAAANEALRRADQMKSELLALATHQLRQPLSIILGYASMLAEGSFGRLPKPAREPLQHIMDSATRMATEITDYLNVAKLDRGRLPYEFAPADLRQLVGDLARDFQPAAAKKALELSFRADPDADYTAEVDAGKIRQVVSNLIENAIHYTEEGSVCLTLSRDERADRLLLTVCDSGIGIDPDALPRLFQRYSRASNARHLRADGSGLGLYVARQFIEAHGGKISAESAGPGKGSTFFIELPARHPPNLPDQTEDASRSHRLNATQKATQAPSLPASVLSP